MYVKCRSCDGLGKKFVKHSKKGSLFGTITKEYPCRACNGTGINQKLYEKNCEGNNGWCSEKIIYPRDAQYPPKYCKNCKARMQEEKAAKAAKWREKSCPGLGGLFGYCGNTIKYNTDWDRIPDLCSSCIAKKKQERENHNKMLTKPCEAGCGRTVEYKAHWKGLIICDDCKKRRIQKLEANYNQNKRFYAACKNSGLSGQQINDFSDYLHSQLRIEVQTMTYDQIKTMIKEYFGR